MVNPRLRHGPNQTKSKSIEDMQLLGGKSSREFGDDQHLIERSLIAPLGKEWFCSFPFLNPIKVIETHAAYPMTAAELLRQGCELMKTGQHVRVHQYIVATYQLGLQFKDNERAIDHLAGSVHDGRSALPVDVEKVKKELLRYLFCYVFYQSGLTSRDRSRQYAQSVQIFFDRLIPAPEVEMRLHKYGQDRLRRAYVRLRKLEDCREWSKNIEQSESGDPDAIITKLIEESKAGEREEDVVKLKAPELSWDANNNDLRSSRDRRINDHIGRTIGKILSVSSEIISSKISKERKTEFVLASLSFCAVLVTMSQSEEIQ